MSKPAAYRHQLRALSRWPKDNLRPETQFQDAIRRRIDRRLSGPSKNESKEPDALADPSKPWNEAEELEQANALYSLAEGRYTRKFPITGSLMEPASNPTHYNDLVAELEAAPKRNWWASITNRWKGFLRFQ